MCDYSLMGIPNRLAKQGENLVICKFKTGSLGLTPVRSDTRAQGVLGRLRAMLRMLSSEFTDEPIAACVPPGARLLLQNVPKYLQLACHVGSTEEVVFTQLTATAYEYRDAVRFQNGYEVLLQDLETGQRARVLELSLPEELLDTESREDLVPTHIALDFIAPRSFGSIRPMREADHE
jgi:hypothetical protein